MTYDEILGVLSKAAGDPESGPVAACLPDLARAMDAKLNPSKPTRETRVVEPTETR